MDLIIVLIAAFFAGVVNTIAGGGTFLTFPALVFIGVPPIVANATSTVAVFPGYLGGALGFRNELGKMDKARILKLILITVSGGVIGSLLLLVSSDKAFSFVVPFLLLAATLVFCFSDQLQQKAARVSQSITPYGTFGLLAVSIYGGYFNGGLGIILLALFTLWSMKDIHLMNGLKSGLSFALSAVSAVVFAVGGLVEWRYAVGMMIASTIGGYAGAPIARALPKRVVRTVVAFIGFSISAIFFVRLF